MKMQAIAASPALLSAVILFAFKMVTGPRVCLTTFRNWKVNCKDNNRLTIVLWVGSSGIVASQQAQQSSQRSESVLVSPCEGVVLLGHALQVTKGDQLRRKLSAELVAVQIQLLYVGEAAGF